ncbi:MAG: hypothetical protein ACFFDW_09755, partial [Candidatus Thorarchaeota archaeon]
MSNRNNKVIIIFSIMLIAMNLFALTQTLATNNQFGGTMKTALPGNASNEALLPLEPTSNGGSVPNLDAWDLTINVTREIEIHDYGYLTVNDNFTIINNDNVTLPIFRFAIDNELVGQLIRIEASSMWLSANHKLNNSQAEVEYQDDQFTYYVMNLNPIVNNNSKYVIKVHQTYLRPYEIYPVVDDSSFLRNGMKMNMSGVPFLTKQIRHCQTSFLKTADGAFINDLIRPTDAFIGEGTVIYTPYTFVPAYNFSEALDYNTYKYRIVAASWMSHQAPTEATNYKRTIYIDNWYYAKIEEEITIKSYAVRPPLDAADYYDLSDARVYATFAVQELHIGVDNAENVKIYDELGTLPVRSPDLPLVQLNQINVYFRVPLYGGDTTTFKMSYTLKLEELLTFDKNEFLLSTKGAPKCPFHIANFELKVVLPQGANFQYLSFGERDVDFTEGKTPIFLRLGTRQSVSFTASNITEYENLGLEVGYFFNDLAYFIQPLTFSLIIFVACLLYVGIRILRKDVIEKVVISPEEKEEIPIQLIQEFV